MPRPIRISILTTGALLLIGSLISISVFWPKLIMLDWRFFRALVIVGTPFAYVVISVFTDHSPCYWMAVALLKLETFQWLVIECFDHFGMTYRNLYPIRERQIRASIGGKE